MRLFQRAKSLILSNVQQVTPQSQTAVLSRTVPETGRKRPVYARPEIKPETGLPSERFDPRQLFSAMGQTGQTEESKRVFTGEPTRPDDQPGFGFRLMDR